ncbi:hypothetical protein BASA60_007159 [Batrachochytrium salamandrivorans]|nr:hypothetical protein BASA60_007159 [Batrachochytrium salamandrivorans]
MPVVDLLEVHVGKVRAAIVSPIHFQCTFIHICKLPKGQQQRLWVVWKWWCAWVLWWHHPVRIYGKWPSRWSPGSFGASLLQTSSSSDHTAYSTSSANGYNQPPISKKPRQNRAGAMGSGGGGDPAGFTALTAEEVGICSTLRILPDQYMHIKEVILTQVERRGPFKKRDAKSWFRLT